MSRPARLRLVLLAGALAARWRRRRRARRQEANANAPGSRAELITTLGGKCALCSTFGNRWKNPLEVDHVDGRGWAVHALSHRDRVARYWAEYRRGVRLRVLCRRCNGRDGQARQRRAA